MAFNTKLSLIDAKFYQPTGGTLVLSGSTSVGTAQYLTNKCASYTARSLADAAYVTGKTSALGTCLQSEINYLSGKTDVNISNISNLGAISGVTNVSITGVTNGLTKVGSHCAKLGGALCETTTINGGQTLRINETTLSLSGNTAFNLSTGCASITDSNNHGLQYTCDYNATFCDESLITKRYVCSQTSGITTGYLCCANNGLTKKGQDVILGGALTGTTTLTCIGTDESQSFMVGEGTCDFTNQYAGGKLYIGRSCVNANHACNMVVANTKSCNGCSSVIVCAELSNGVYSMFCNCNGLNRTTTLGTNALLYGNDYSSCFIARSIPDAAWVTGKTKNITNVGSQGEVIYRDATKLTGCTNMIYCDAKPSFAFGRSNTASGNDSAAFGRSNTASGNDSATLGGCNNTAAAVCSAIVGGQINNIDSGALRAVIIGGQNINLAGTGSTYQDTVAVDCLAIFCTPTGTGDLLCWNATNKKVGVTSLSAFGGLTGATNGLSTCGQDVLLGGVLSADTSICGGGLYDLCLGKSTSKLDYLWVNANCACVITSNLGISSSGATFTDLRAGTGRTGILYASDYSLGFLPRSLVDKGYVDSVATGLNVHTAVIVATTGPIVLSGSPQTIDGISAVNGDRVLVKDQGGVSGNTANGIYIVSASGWTRSSDYDGTPSGEVANGDLIPVTSGDTQNNTLWALTTLNPITVGVTPLLFSLFGSVIDVQAGAGIAITQVGGVHTVCVNLGANSGLNTASGLVIGAGCGLSTSGGVLNVNAADTLCSAIPVLDNAGNCLVVACADILGVMAGAATLTGATNGLCATSGVVCLGGLLTEANTDINGNSSYCLSLTCLKEFHLGFCCSIVTDTGLNHGLVYAGDYESTFIARSLITAQYVTGLTSCGITTANNGLTKYGQNVVLGGALTGDTQIGTGLCGLAVCSCTYFNVQVGDGTTNSYLNVCCGTNTLTTADIGTSCASVYTEVAAGVPDATMFAVCGSNNACVRVDLAGGVPTATMLVLCGSDFACVGVGAACVSIAGNASGFPGAVYGADYSLNFVDESLITKRYVCSQVSGVTGCAILCANNGLTKLGQNVVLGGALTGNTTVGNNTCTLKIKVATLDLTGSTAFNLSTGCGLITTSNSKGLEYAANYNATFDNESLITKRYVCSQTSGITTGYLCCANNGLTKVGQNVVLGGALTGTTYITTSTGVGLYVTGDTSFGLELTCSIATIGDVRAGAGTGAYIGVAGGCGGIDIRVKCANNNINICNAGSGTGNVCIQTTGLIRLNASATTLQVTPLSGVPLVDAVLVWNSTDKKIKQVSGAALGDKNNVYSKEVIGVTAVTLTTGSSYVILISPSAATTITLPSTPKDGEAFKLKDISGNALTLNIVVDAGAGKQIDNNQCALINTDYGALEIMYESAAGKWYSLAFIN